MRGFPFLHRWRGDNLRRGLNWNTHGELVWFWIRRDGTRFRIYFRCDIQRWFRGLKPCGFVADGVSYTVDSDGATLEARNHFAFTWDGLKPIRRKGAR